MNKSSKLITLLATGAFALCASPAAHAAATLEIWDGTGAYGTGADGVTVTASGTSAAGTVSGYGAYSNLIGGAADTYGSAYYLGSLGNFTVTDDAGATQPTAGSGSNNLPVLSLGYSSTLGSTITTGGTINIEFSQTGYTLMPANFLTSIGGSAPLSGPGYTLTYSTYINNTLLSTVNENGVSFNSNLWDSVTGVATPYSLTQLITINYNAGETGEISGNAYLQTPDGGLTAALLGASFLGLAAAHRKLRLA